MKPYTKKPVQKMGSTESLQQSWAFSRQSQARAKRKTRGTRRRADKQELKKDLDI